MGENCKYNGGNNRSEKVLELLAGNEVIPVCPEKMGGLPTPRIPAEIVDGEVMNKAGISVDKEYRLGAEMTLEVAVREQPDLIILQSRSPSCGVNERYDGSFSGKLIKGSGITAELLIRNGFNVVDVEDLYQMSRAPKTGWELPVHFFRDNPIRDNLTTGELMWFQMKTVFDTDVGNMISEYVLPTFDEARKETMQLEKEAIERLSTPEEVVRFMRKQIEISNRDFLCRKAVSMGGELSSLIIDKLMKNGIDTFIECAVLILSRAEEVYIDRIAVEFPQFRNSYARAEATVLLAYRGRKDALKSIYDEYTELSRSKDPEIYRLSQTVLYSIYMLTGKTEDMKIDTDQFRRLTEERG